MYRRNYQTDNDPIPEEEYYSTFDLGCAAALICVDYELVSLDKSNPRKVNFLFQHERGLEKTVSDYWSDKLKVPARTLFDNTKMLKNRIYSN